MNSLEIATKSLKANIIALPSGKFVSAGQNQFLTLWTRDFCHAVRGLILVGEKDVAKNHLSYLLKSLRDDGLVPRVLDNQVVQVRVAWQSFRKLCPVLPKLAFKEPLRPQYTDEHGSHAVDSNLLVLLASLMIDDGPWWNQHENELKKVFRWYDSQWRDGLIWQSGFSDWQDSVKREGHTFLTNLFYFLAATRLKKRGFEVKINLEDYKSKIHDTFFHNGLYKTMMGSEIISLEGNLFAIEVDEFLSLDEKKNLWKELLKHPLGKEALGACSYPSYSNNDIAWHVKFARLHGYHDKLAWSWLMGLGLKVSILMNDELKTDEQLKQIENNLDRDAVVMELYDPDKNWLPWESWLLKAEHPFAWGAGYLVEALTLLRNKK